MPNLEEKNALLQRYHNVKERIEKARQQAGRKADITLLAVSKTKPLWMVETLAQAGQQDFGENYVQEGIEKVQATEHREDLPKLSWHFIGPIQSNKTKQIAQHFDWVHSIDRLKIARRLSEQRPEEKGELQVLIEVNISQEASKAGVMPNEVLELAKQIAELPNLHLRGLMCIPQKAQTLEEQRRPFRQMRELLKTLQAAQPDLQLDTLSMGMSADLEAAILEGATLVRIGTDIFGARQ
jgi:pyridoxal phosphate enzyme (YggS family)